MPSVLNESSSAVREKVKKIVGIINDDKTLNLDDDDYLLKLQLKKILEYINAAFEKGATIDENDDVISEDKTFTLNDPIIKPILSNNNALDSEKVKEIVKKHLKRQLTNEKKLEIANAGFGALIEKTDNSAGQSLKIVEGDLTVFSTEQNEGNPNNASNGDAISSIIKSIRGREDNAQSITKRASNFLENALSFKSGDAEKKLVVAKNLFKVLDAVQRASEEIKITEEEEEKEKEKETKTDAIKRHLEIQNDISSKKLPGVTHDNLKKISEKVSQISHTSTEPKELLLLDSLKAIEIIEGSIQVEILPKADLVILEAIEANYKNKEAEVVQKDLENISKIIILVNAGYREYDNASFQQHLETQGFEKKLAEELTKAVTTSYARTVGGQVPTTLHRTEDKIDALKKMLKVVLPQSSLLAKHPLDSIEEFPSDLLRHLLDKQRSRLDQNKITCVKNLYSSFLNCESSIEAIEDLDLKKAAQSSYLDKNTDTENTKIALELLKIELGSDYSFTLGNLTLTDKNLKQGKVLHKLVSDNEGINDIHKVEGLFEILNLSANSSSQEEIVDGYEVKGDNKENIKEAMNGIHLNLIKEEQDQDSVRQGVLGDLFNLSSSPIISNFLSKSDKDEQLEKILDHIDENKISKACKSLMKDSSLKQNQENQEDILKKFIEAVGHQRKGELDLSQKLITEIIKEYGLDDETQQQELELRSLADPKDGDPSGFSIPELKNINLKKEDGVQKTSYIIQFKNQNDRDSFKTKLLWSDVYNNPGEPDTKSIKLSFDKGDDFPIGEICKKIIGSDQAKEFKKESVKKREDRTTKKVIAGVLNGATFGIPVVGASCHFAGKIFQGIHQVTGLGDSVAKLLFDVADITYRNSNWIPEEYSHRFKKDITRSVDRIRQSNENNYAKGFPFSLIRGAFAVAGGIVSVSANVTGGIANYFGDGLLNTSENCYKNLQREDTSLFGKVGYGLVGLTTFVAGAPFRAAGFTLRTVGEAVKFGNIDGYKGDENSVANFVNGVSDFFSRTNSVLPEQTPQLFKDLTNKEYKFSKENDHSLSKNTDSQFEKIRTEAQQIFKSIRDPKFTVSGIKDDTRKYCEIAQLHFSGRTFSLLYSPTDGAVAIVDPIKTQNSERKANQWPEHAMLKDNNIARNNFISLLQKANKKNENKKHYDNKDDDKANWAKIIKGNDKKGLTYTEFETKLNFAKDKNLLKAEESKEFKIGTSKYELKREDNSLKLFHKTSSGFSEELLGLDKFQVINDLYKTNAVLTEEPKTKENKSHKPKGKNHDSPKGKDIKIISATPLSKALEKASPEKIYVR